MSIHIKTKPRVRYSNLSSVLLLIYSSWRGYKRHSTGCQANMALQLDSGGHSLSTFNNSSTAVTPASTDLQMSDVIQSCRFRPDHPSEYQSAHDHRQPAAQLRGQHAAGENSQQVNGSFIIHIIVNFLTKFKNKQFKNNSA